MRNTKIHKACKDYGVKKWEVADRIGVADNTLSKMLRRELAEAKQNEIIETIINLAKEKREQEAE